MTEAAVTSANQLYQHIQIFGRDSRYIVRPDNDPAAEKTFRTYIEAVLWACQFMLGSVEIKVQDLIE